MTRKGVSLYSPGMMGEMAQSAREGHYQPGGMAERSAFFSLQSLL
jgi:hypothetical protein